MNRIFMTDLFASKIKSKSIGSLVFRAAGLVVCFLFLFSDAKMIYLSFNGNGMKGFGVGFFNVLAVHIVFLTVFHASLFGSLKPQPFVLTVGTLLSCNAAYYAAVWQSLFDSETVAIQPFLYLLPLISTFIFLLLTKKPERHCLKPLLIQNLYLTIGIIYVLTFPLFPMNRYFQYWNQGNVLFIVLLSVCQVLRNRSLKSKSATETR